MIKLHPSFEEFEKSAALWNLIPIYAEILADLETPVTAFAKIASDSSHAFLFESVVGGEKWGRYCFLGSGPSVIFRAKDGVCRISRNGSERPPIRSENPLHELRKLIKEYRPAPAPGLPRFFGGAVGFLGYDSVRYFEQLPGSPQDDLQMDDCCFLVTDTLLIFDNTAQKIQVVANAHVDGGDLREIYENARKKILSIVEKLKRPSPLAPLNSGVSGKAPLEFASNFRKEDFEKAVLKAKDYIRDGDIIQVVLAQRLRVSIQADPLDIYRCLRSINPSPYMYFLRFNDIEIVGSSPEVMVRMEEERLELRPIAGTRKRGADEPEDKALAEDLLSDEKELAEHIMLVDLGRNDLGRVSETGSVEVNELKTIERYSHVMHIVSNVRGKIRRGKDAFDVIAATFPAGTVSGAPKVRAMEIIDELESDRRGLYAGAVGYFSFSGNMDTAIAIRTLVIKDKKTAYLGVGAGIVSDSVPEKEFEETMNKGRALLKAMEMAEGQVHNPDEP
ncbi:MAG: anthranilate synthase component I [Nitrospinae bacterium]|nr:anthranilate synthase component I [Nitrospinota bacterium]